MRIPNFISIFIRSRIRWHYANQLSNEIEDWERTAMQMNVPQN